MQGEEQKRSERNCFLVSHQKTDLFKISTRIPFDLSWGPGLLPSNFASARREMQSSTGPTSCCSLFHAGESFGSLGSAMVTHGCHTPANQLKTSLKHPLLCFVFLCLLKSSMKLLRLPWLVNPSIVDWLFNWFVAQVLLSSSQFVFIFMTEGEFALLPCLYTLWKGSRHLNVATTQRASH